MKKRDVIKQKQKLKHLDAIKWIRYASNVCIGLVVLLLVLVGVIMSINQVSFEEMVGNNPFIALSFTVAIENLFAWYILKKMMAWMQALINIESAKIMLCCVAIVELIMMNFVTSMLLVVALVKCFDWSQFSISGCWKQLKKDKQLKYVAGIVGIQIVLAYLFLVVSFLLYGMN